MGETPPHYVRNGDEPRIDSLGQRIAFLGLGSRHFRRTDESKRPDQGLGVTGAAEMPNLGNLARPLDLLDLLISQVRFRQIASRKVDTNSLNDASYTCQNST